MNDVHHHNQRREREKQKEAIDSYCLTKGKSPNGPTAPTTLDGPSLLKEYENARIDGSRSVHTNTHTHTQWTPSIWENIEKERETSPRKDGASSFDHPKLLWLLFGTLAMLVATAHEYPNPPPPSSSIRTEYSQSIMCVYVCVCNESSNPDEIKSWRLGNLYSLDILVIISYFLSLFFNIWLDRNVFLYSFGS